MVQNGDNNQDGGGLVVEEIPGIIKVYNNGHVERPLLVPDVPPGLPSELGISSKDITIDTTSDLWARIYAPTQQGAAKFPLLVYFHGGGFCVGTASWACYHDFLSNLASKASCVIMSVNYRLAPENRLPAAYEDGINFIGWLNNQATNGFSDEHKWWLHCCNFSRVFLVGDSAGANIAQHVATKIESNTKAINIEGIVLIQPFTGSEERTNLEKQPNQPDYGILPLSTCETFWRLALPVKADRDHPWCNSLSTLTKTPRTLVCISELDILKDRNMDLCATLTKVGTKVEKVVLKDVGHSFHLLHNYPRSQERSQEMMNHLKVFISS